MPNASDNNQALYAVRDLIAPIADISFFIKLGDSGINYSDDELANIIKAENYAKTKKKVEEFAARKRESLESFRQQNVLAKEAELEAAQSQADANRPGSGPSELFLDKTDINAVNRHNQRVEEHNHQVDLYRRLIDKRDQAKERYEDALDRYKDKQDEVEEQIREKKEELKPAIDRDMVSFLGKLQQLVYDCFRNKALIFESFVLLFMAKKAYIFLYDRIGDADGRITASNIFRQLSNELETLVEKHSDDLKQGFTEIIAYVYDCFQENEAIFNALQEQLEHLPYDTCDVNGDSARSLVSLLIDTNFQYKDIIDPNELARMEARVQERRDQFEDRISEIDEFANQMLETFDSLDEVLADSQTKLQLIHQNRDTCLGETFDFSRFVLGVFNEEVQDEYLKQEKSLLEAMQLDIETSLNVNLTKLIKTILETELFVLSAAQVINTNSGFAFLEYRRKLQQKRQELKDGISTLDLHLQDISRQPKEQAEEFAAQIQKLLGLSILPLGNLGVLIPMHQSIQKFSPALGSGHPVYAEVCEKTKSKLQSFFVAHAVIAVLIGGGSFATGDNQKPLILGGAGAYGISAGALFLKKKHLTEL